MIRIALTAAALLLTGCVAAVATCNLVQQALKLVADLEARRNTLETLHDTACSTLGNPQVCTTTGAELEDLEDLLDEARAAVTVAEEACALLPSLRAAHHHQDAERLLEHLEVRAQRFTNPP